MTQASEFYFYRCALAGVRRTRFAKKLTLKRPKFPQELANVQTLAIKPDLRRNSPPFQGGVPKAGWLIKHQEKNLNSYENHTIQTTFDHNRLSKALRINKCPKLKNKT